MKIFIKYLIAYFWVLSKRLVIRSYKQDGKVENDKINLKTYIFLSDIAYYYMYKSDELCVDGEFIHLGKKAAQFSFTRRNFSKKYPFEKNQNILLSPFIRVLFSNNRRWIWIEIGYSNFVFFQDAGFCRILKWSEYRKFLKKFPEYDYDLDHVDDFLYKLWEDSLEA